MITNEKENPDKKGDTREEKESNQVQVQARRRGTDLESKESKS